MDYFITDEVQEILDRFSDLFGIRIALFSPAGKELRVGAALPARNLHCECVRSALGLEARCHACDHTHRRKALASGGLHVYQCHAGLTEAIVPLMADATCLGYVMIGQFRTEGLGRQAFERLLARAPNRKTFRSSWDALPVYSRPRRQQILGLFEILVRYISSQQMIQRRHLDPLAVVQAYLQENLHRRVSLEEAALQVHRSPSTLSHLFSRRLGRSFRQVQIDCKLDAAEILLQTRPDMTVQAIAHEVGYNDPLYFSRLYKRHRGMAPSQAR